MNENEFELDGKIYVAMEQDSFPFCEGCAFDALPCGHLPECTLNKRRDGINVIFVEKQQ